MKCLPASSISRHIGLAPMLLIWMYDKVVSNRECDGIDLATQEILSSTRIDAGYCLDAPETMPAGGCEWVDVDETGGLPMQLEARREEPQ